VPHTAFRASLTRAAAVGLAAPPLLSLSPTTMARDDMVLAPAKGVQSHPQERATTLPGGTVIATAFIPGEPRPPGTTASCSEGVCEKS
jgi:hypothetical protein